MGLEQLEQVWDHLPSLEAVLRAWQEPGPSYGSWHKTARAEVAYLMPLLARALDRAQLEHADLLPDRDERLWGWPEGFRPRDAVRIDRAGLRGRRAVGGDR